MILPHSLYTSTVAEKDIFYFVTDKINSSEPHYFICIKKTNNQILLFTCCTTKGGKRESHLLKTNGSLETIVYIRPGHQGNKLTQESYVDCNNYQEFTIDEFKSICDSGKIQYKGTLSDDYYIQILIGLHKSDNISDETKDILPKPDDV